MADETPPAPAPPPFANRRAIDTPQFQELQKKTDAIQVRQVQQGERVSYFGKDLEKVWGALVFLFIVATAGFVFATWIAGFAPRAELKEVRTQLNDSILGTPTTEGINEKLRKDHAQLEQLEHRVEQLEHPPTRKH